jgi:Phage portal protein, lambda family
MKKSASAVASKTKLAGRTRPPARRVSVVRERPRPKNYWWQYFEAADRRDYRTGWFYFPNLSPVEQMDKLSVHAVIERGDYLYHNCPPFRAAINGLALDEVGLGLWPSWTTSNPEFNKEVTEAFHAANSDPRSFSMDGRTDFYSAQLIIRILIRRYGDSFGQFVRQADRPTSNGFGSIMPGMNLVPGYLVENAGDEEKDSRWVRGVLPDKFSRATKYRVLDKEGAQFSASGQSGSVVSYTDVPAEDMLQFFDPMVPGQLRGMPVATSIAKKMFRFEDVKRAIANGTLSREMLGFAIELEGDTGPGPAIKLPGAREVHVEQIDAVGAVDQETGEATSTPSKFTVQSFFGFDQQDRVVVPELRNGAKFRMLESNRPGTQTMEFLDSILRELAWASEYPPEWVFFVSSSRQGTVSRVVLQKANSIMNAKREFQLKPQFVTRWPIFWVWNGWIKPGRGKAAVPDDWYRFKVGGVRDMTVDIGREGRLYDERVSTNKMSIPTYHAMFGEDDNDVEDENLAVIERRINKLNALNKKMGTNFTYYDIWPRTAGFSGSDIAAAAQAPDPANPHPADPGGNGNGTGQQNRLVHR